MIFNEKKKYVAPEMEVIDMECRCILCGSDENVDNGDPDELIVESEN